MDIESEQSEKFEVSSIPALESFAFARRSEWWNGTSVPFPVGRSSEFSYVRRVSDGDLPVDVSVGLLENVFCGGSVVYPDAAAESYFGPLVIVSPDLVAVSCNGAARSVLEHSERIRIRDDGRFSVYPNALDTGLKKIVGSFVLDPSCRSDRRSIMVCDATGRPSHVVVASPLLTEEGACRHVMLTLVEFESSRQAAPSSVTEYFRLTERECEFLCHFVRGCSVDEAVKLMAISKNTGRVHLRNVVPKTVARNQVDLLRRILKFPAMVGAASFDGMRM